MNPIQQHSGFFSSPSFPPSSTFHFLPVPHSPFPMEYLSSPLSPRTKSRSNWEAAVLKRDFALSEWRGACKAERAARRECSISSNHSDRVPNLFASSPNPFASSPNSSCTYPDRVQNPNPLGSPITKSSTDENIKNLLSSLAKLVTETTKFVTHISSESHTSPPKH